MTAIETFGDLFKRDFIEAGSIYARRALRTLDISPYLGSLLKRGLKRGEARETIEPVVELGMMFSAMVGVELTQEMVDINQRTDDLKAEVETRFEAAERVEESLRERLERESASRVGISHRVEILEEARRGTQQYLESLRNERRLETARVRSIGARCSILESREKEGFQDMEAMKALLKAQTRVINQQTEVIQNLERQVEQLRVIALEAREAVRDLREPRGNTLGDPILVEDSEEEEEVVEVFEAEPRVVTELVLIEDE